MWFFPSSFTIQFSIIFHFPSSCYFNHLWPRHFIFLQSVWLQLLSNMNFDHFGTSTSYSLSLKHQVQWVLASDVVSWVFSTWKSFRFFYLLSFHKETCLLLSRYFVLPALKQTLKAKMSNKCLCYTGKTWKGIQSEPDNYSSKCCI